MDELELWLQERIGEQVGLTYRGGVQCGGRIECVGSGWVRLTDPSTSKASICSLEDVLAAFEPTAVATAGRTIAATAARRPQ